MRWDAAKEHVRTCSREQQDEESDDETVGGSLNGCLGSGAASGWAAVQPSETDAGHFFFF